MHANVALRQIFRLQSGALFSAVDRPPFTFRVFGNSAHRMTNYFVTASAYQPKTSISTGLENNTTEGASALPLGFFQLRCLHGYPIARSVALIVRFPLGT